MAADSWWGAATGTSPEEAYKRLIESCRLAVEEAYTMSGDVIGSYAEQAGDWRGEGIMFFRAFVSAATRKGLMPAWWDRGHVERCEIMGLGLDERHGDFCIMHAREVSDVRETWGALTTSVLRLFARRVHDAIDDEDYAFASLGLSDEDDEYDDESYHEGEDGDALARAFCGAPGDEADRDYHKQGKIALQAIDRDAADGKAVPELAARASQECKQFLTRLVAERHARAEAAKMEGNAFAARSEWDAARAAYDAARKLVPLDHVFHANFSHSCLELAKQDGAGSAQLLDSAVAAGWITCHLKPEWPKAYGRLGAALLALGKPAIAANVLDDGLVACRKGKGDAAYRKWLDEALAACYEQEEAQEALISMALGAVSVQLEDPREALEMMIDDFAEETREYLGQMPRVTPSALLARVMTCSKNITGVGWQEQEELAKGPAMRLLAALLVHVGASLHAPEGSCDSRVLHWAAELGDPALIARLQALPTPGGSSPLAAIENSAVGTAMLKMHAKHDPYGHRQNEQPYNAAAIYQLLEHTTPDRLNVRLTGPYNGQSRHPTPLAAAVDMLDLQLVARLLEKGADPNFPPTANDDRCYENRDKPLYHAMGSDGCGYEDDLEPRVKEVLAKRPPLRHQIVKLLLDAGADANVPGLIGKYDNRRSEAVCLLIEHGASADNKQAGIAWSDEKSVATLEVNPSDEEWAKILSTSGLSKIVVGHDYSDGGMQTLKGRFPSITALDLSYAYSEGGTAPSSDAAFVAGLLKLLPGLQELSCASAEFMSDKALAKLPPALRVLELSGTPDGYEDSRYIHVSNGGLAKLAAACSSLQKLSIGSCVGLESPGPSKYQHEQEWEHGADGHAGLSICCLQGLANASQLQSLCLQAFGNWYGEPQTKLLQLAQSISLPAPMESLEVLGLNLLLTDDNLAAIFPHTPNLRSVALASPLITDAGLGHLAVCAKLQLCQVANTEVRVPKFGDAGVRQLVGGCKQLVHVTLRGSRSITDVAIGDLALAAPKLRTLALDGAPESFGCATVLSILLAKCPELEKLQLHGTRGMTTEAMRIISRFENLSVLDLYCDFTDDALRQVAGLFAGGFAKLTVFRLNTPHEYRPSLLRAAGIKVKGHYSDRLEPDLGPFKALQEGISSQRPGLIPSDSYRERYDHSKSTAAQQISLGVLLNFAAKERLTRLTRGYWSDYSEEDEDAEVQPQPAAMVAASASESQKVCTQCHAQLPQSSFSKTQWKKRDADGTRRCKLCVGN